MFNLIGCKIFPKYPLPYIGKDNLEGHIESKKQVRMNSQISSWKHKKAQAH